MEKFKQAAYDDQFNVCYLKDQIKKKKKNYSVFKLNCINENEHTSWCRTLKLPRGPVGQSGTPGDVIF